MLASFKDTITANFLKYLIAISEDEKDRISLSVRLALLEDGMSSHIRLMGSIPDKQVINDYLICRIHRF